MIQFVLVVLAIPGAVVTLIGSVGAFIWAVDTIRDWRSEPHRRSFAEGQADRANRLANDAWWFSESTETCELLRDLANGVSVSEARERWRKARASATTESQG